MSYVTGVDIGGSHITAAIVNLETGQVLNESRSRRMVDPKGGAEDIIRDWCTVIEAAASAQVANGLKIGIAMPGPFEYEKGICLIQEQEKFRQLYGINVKVQLAQALKTAPENIRLLNDAACFLQGEVLYGAGKGAAKVLGLTLGTGLGSAVHTNGVTLNADLWSTPFKNGIAEDVLSSRWFVKKYKCLTGKTVSGVKAMMDAADEPERTEIFTEFSENLAAFLLPQLKDSAIEKVVFGGNISQTEAHFFPLLKGRLRLAGCGVELCRGILHEDAALIGAAGCWTGVADPQPAATGVSSAIT